MADVLIIGDGPGGLSAALFLAKRGLSVSIYGKDDTPMHKAKLLNYLGIPEITGSEFQAVAREQVTSFGAELHDDEVTSLERADDGFALETESGSTDRGRYLILAVSNKSLYEQLELDPTPEVDLDMRTPVEDVYAVGWPVRKKKIQAIISAGDGAAAALDILSKEEGEDIHDFDVVDS
jgi:thioredoxin reductase